jgi:prephenate dehydrogenase
VSSEVKTLTVVGLGLIGGSLVRAVKARGLPYRVNVVARREETRRLALESGVVDRVFGTVAEAAPTADIAVLALPVLAIPAAFREMSPRLRGGTIVTDVGSTKGSLIENLEEDIPPGISFVGGHPIAGTEDSGFESSFPDLFDGARCILTPGKTSTPEAVREVRALWEGVGSRVETMEGSIHDRILAVISHLPHVVAYALVNAAAAADGDCSGLLGYTGGGFRDFTRIAASHPAMWRDICLDNREEILSAIDLFLRETERLRDMIREKDGPGLETSFNAARTVRRSLTSGKNTEPA